MCLWLFYLLFNSWRKSLVLIFCQRDHQIEAYKKKHTETLHPLIFWGKKFLLLIIVQTLLILLGMTSLIYILHSSSLNEKNYIEILMSSRNCAKIDWITLVSRKRNLNLQLICRHLQIIFPMQIRTMARQLRGCRVGKVGK